VLAAIATTVSTRQQADALAVVMVQRGLAACAQLVPIDSIYLWEGKLRQEPEVRVVFKTTVELQDKLMAAVAECHPYEVPEIHAETLPLVHQPYADWVAASVAGPPP
jgi:periplasmic divalent cation tolerance protein